MSADSWTYCLKCRRDSEALISDGLEKLRAQYGKIPEADYLATANALADDAERLPRSTLKENYQVGIDEDRFLVKYRASCTECGFSFEFDHNEVIEFQNTVEKERGQV